MKNKAVIFIIAGASLWGVIGIFVRTLTAAGFSPMQMVAFRAYISAAVLVVWLAVKSPAKLKIRLRDAWCFAGTGIVSFVFFNFCYFTAINEVSLSVAAILLYTAPMFVMLLSIWLFKEKMTKRKLIALLLAFGGCVLVTGLGGGAQVTRTGVVAGLLSGFLYALYSIFARYALRRYDSITVTAYTFLFACIGATPFAALPELGGVVNGSVPLVLYLILFAVVSGVLPYLLYTRGLADVEAGKASVMASVEPVVATLVGVIAFGEAFTWEVALGVAAVVGALAILNLPGKKQSPKNDRPPAIQ